MCGIFGILVKRNSKLSSSDIENLINDLFELSESRGKEASGVIIKSSNKLQVFKNAVPSSELIKSNEFINILDSSIRKWICEETTNQEILAILGHSRLVTNGRSELNSNNQPVIKDEIVGIHNGIIVNDDALWNKYPNLKKNYDVDTEVLLSLLQGFHKNDQTLTEAVRSTYQELEGSASIALAFKKINSILLATNTGSLYIIQSVCGSIILFASEKYTLKQIVNKSYLRDIFNLDAVNQIHPGTGKLISLSTLTILPFNLYDNSHDLDSTPFEEEISLEIIDLSPSEPPKPDRNISHYRIEKSLKDEMLKIWNEIYSNSTAIRRCTRCLLPDTMPFITFDENGVCNHCREFDLKRNSIKGEKALKEFVEKYRKSTGEPDVLIGFSGGRDSSYGLWYIKNTLKMHPLTFIYDWGMVTDLARRNQARICGKLGIEQIIVSADIRKKREYIRKNFEAWLKRPNLGMVPILMAGDKEFYHYFHKIRKENGIKLFIFCGGYEGEESSGLFKLGFCGVDRSQGTAEYRMTGISLKNKIKLLWFYFKNYLLNPSYINSSLFDTLFAFYSSYVLTDDYLYLYQYLPWDEKTIVSTIREEFGWELESDTPATWRTDDGTAAIYNYIYFTIAGFTEFDGIRSHQIREGKLTREEALAIVKEENKPRFNSIEWYAETIGFDVNKALRIINNTERLYKN